MAEATPKKPVQTRVRSPHHRVVYCNQIGTTTTSTEVRLRIGVIEQQDSERQEVEDQVDVMMGPMMVIGLRDLLDRIIKKHFVELKPAVPSETEAK